MAIGGEMGLWYDGMILGQDLHVLNSAALVVPGFEGMVDV